MVGVARIAGVVAVIAGAVWAQDAGEAERARRLEVELRRVGGERAAEVRAQLEQVLAREIRAAEERVKGAAAGRELFEALLEQGQLSARRAKVAVEREALLASGRRALEKLVAEAGAESPWGLRGRVALAENALVGERWREAAQGFEGVLDAALAADAAAWNELARGMGEAEKHSRVVLASLALPGLVDALAAVDRGDRAAAWSLHVLGVWRGEKLALAPALGDPAELAAARALAAAGGWLRGDVERERATWCATRAEAGESAVDALAASLAIARRVAAANDGNELELDARALIDELASRPQARLDPAALLEDAAERAEDGDWSGVLERARGALATLSGEDAATQRALAPEALWHTGRAFAEVGRHLEAAAAFERVLDDWRGDPRSDQRCARGLFESLQALRRQVERDAELDARLERAEALVAQTGGAFGAEIAYVRAERLLDQREYERARAAFAAVDPAAESYEKALVQLGVCELELGRRAEANAAFERYLGPWLADPAHAADDPRRLAKRDEARAIATFHRGRSAVELAELGRGAWSDVVTWLGDFEQRFPTQSSFAPAAAARTVQAEIALGNLERAATALERLRAQWPDSPWLGRAAKQAYDELASRRARETDPLLRARWTRGMAESLALLNRTAPALEFDNLRQESKLWLELGEWSAAEATLRRLQQRYAESAAGDEARAVREWVLPDLGHALLEQRRAADAAAVLRPLVEAGGAARRTTRDYARALAGWLSLVPAASGAPARVEQVPGSARDAELETAIHLLDDLADAAERWTAEWYALELDLIWALKQASRADRAKLDLARHQLTFIERDLGPGFAHQSMPEDLRALYAWLAAALD